MDDVDEISSALSQLNIDVEPPRLYPEYSPDYYAIFFKDPDGVRLEVTNFRKNRQDRYYHWEQVKSSDFG